MNVSHMKFVFKNFSVKRLNLKNVSNRLTLVDRKYSLKWGNGLTDYGLVKRDIVTYVVNN